MQLQQSINTHQIYVYNEQVIQGGIKPNLVHLMTEVSETIDDQVSFT